VPLFGLPLRTILYGVLRTCLLDILWEETRKNRYLASRKTQGCRPRFGLQPCVIAPLTIKRNSVTSELLESDERQQTKCTTTSKNRLGTQFSIHCLIVITFDPEGRLRRFLVI
jgi:hypothetical protein